MFFWDAPRPGGASFVWKSICDARCVLKRGTRWKIGNGRSVSVWYDTCLPRLSTLPCLDIDLVNLKVCDLLLSSGDWNETLVRSIFLNEDADII